LDFEGNETSISKQTWLFYCFRTIAVACQHNVHDSQIDISIYHTYSEISMRKSC
jgi:hypothetical protein